MKNVKHGKPWVSIIYQGLSQKNAQKWVFLTQNPDKSSKIGP
jgi:hypothetical protein